MRFYLVSWVVAGKGNCWWDEGHVSGYWNYHTSEWSIWRKNVSLGSQGTFHLFLYMAHKLFGQAYIHWSRWFPRGLKQLWDRNAQLLWGFRLKSTDSGGVDKGGGVWGDLLVCRWFSMARVGVMQLLGGMQGDNSLILHIYIIIRKALSYLFWVNSCIL